MGQSRNAEKSFFYLLLMIGMGYVVQIFYHEACINLMTYPMLRACILHTTLHSSKAPHYMGWGAGKRGGQG